MDDTYFKRSVILLCDHNDEGTFGFILNKPIELELSDLVNAPIAPADALSMGGPVETDHVYYLHTHGDEIPGSVKVSGNIYMGGEFEKLTEISSAPGFDPMSVRYFLGYSGWDAGQLEAELATESWYVADPKGLDIFDYRNDIDNLWARVIRSMGGIYANLANFPENPMLN